MSGQATRPLRFLPDFVGRRLEGKTRGQALVMVGVMMMTLLGFGAMVVDGGMLWYNQRLMQNAVDAAALAGAQQLTQTADQWDKTGTGARQIAHEYAMNKNGVSNMTVNSSPQGPTGSESCNANPSVDILVCRTNVANDSIRVTARKSFKPLVGIVLGFATIEIRTKATAVVGSIKSACVAPFYQTVERLQKSGVWGSNGIILNTPLKMVTQENADDGTGGNRLLLALPDTDLRTALHPARCAAANPPQTSGTAETYPGQSWGQADQGLKDRKDAWNAQGNCVDPVVTKYLREDGRLWKFPLGTAGNVELTTHTCYRMVVVPIMPYVSNGRHVLPIVGFARFYISNWCGAKSDPPAEGQPGRKTCAAPAGSSQATLNETEIWGYFVGMEAAGGQDFAAYDGFGTKTVALIG